MNDRVQAAKQWILRPHWLHILFAGLFFTLVLYAGLAQIPREYFQARDDGIITLSHARNWVEYGFIGVNPSGERVEGYSAPVQMGLFALVYGLTHLDFQTFFQGQFALFTFLLGAALYAVNRETPWRAVLITLGAGLLLILINPFLEWQASGMENAITHALLAVSVVWLWESLRAGRVRYAAVPVVFLASISRAETIYYIVPLLVVYLISYWLEHRSAGGLAFTGLVLLLWAGYQAARFTYFGEPFPNTAFAQGISVFANLTRLVSLDPAYLSLWAGPAWQAFLACGGVFLLLGLPLVFCAKLKKSDVFFVLALLALATLTLLNPYLFGEARLDAYRSSTQVAVIALLWIAFLVNRLKMPLGGGLLALAMLAGLVWFPTIRVQPYDLCCGIEEMEHLSQSMAQFARENHIDRLTVAEPDLGVISWQKQFNIVDLGGLGSPLLVRLKPEPRLAYFLLAAPDVVEAHAMWSELYSNVLVDPRFQAVYQRVQDQGGWKNVAEHPQGIWVRNDILKDANTPERKFLDELQAHWSIDRILQEYQAARLNGQNTAYVTRTVYRFLPEIDRAGQYEALMSRLEPLDLPGFDRYLLTGLRDARAYQVFLAEVTAK